MSLTEGLVIFILHVFGDLLNSIWPIWISSVATQLGSTHEGQTLGITGDNRQPTTFAALNPSVGAILDFAGLLIRRWPANRQHHNKEDRKQYR